MILEFADWQFDVDIEATWNRTQRYSLDHCECGYCKNFYEAVDHAHPYFRPFLEQWGVNINGPCEVMPFEPTLVLVCYRLDGQILHWGSQPLSVHGIPVVPETGDGDTFLLWIGELELPWLQEEAQEDVISPANLPEFLERMQDIWLMRHGEELVFS